MMQKLPLVLLIGCLLAGCPSDQPPRSDTGTQVSSPTAGASSRSVVDENPESSVSGFRLTILPSPPTVVITQLRLDVAGCRVDELQNIAWQINGEIVGSEAILNFGKRKLHRNDQIEVEADCRKHLARSSTTVVNSPPWIKDVELANPALTSGQPITLILQTVDPDGDTVSVMPDWRVNGEPMPEIDGLELPANYVETGAEIEVRLTPDDGYEQGRKYMINKFIVPNQPPRFVSSPPQEIDAFPWSYTAKAVDPDGDQVSYQLDKGPEGMTIDSESGDLRWTPIPGVYGQFAVRIRALDSQKQADQQIFTLTLPRPESP